MEESNIERACMLGIAIISGIVLAVVTNAPKWATSEVAAAWVQAVGSIAAIVFSLGVARRQTKAQEILEQRRRENEVNDRRKMAHKIAVDLALVMFTEVAQWAKRLELLNESILEASGSKRRELLWKSINDTGAWTLPGSVDRMLGRFHELQDAADNVQIAIISTQIVEVLRQRINAEVRYKPLDFVLTQSEGDIQRVLAKQYDAVVHAAAAIRYYAASNTNENTDSDV